MDADSVTNEIPELTHEEQITALKGGFKMFLNQLGIGHNLEIIFLDYAIQKSRQHFESAKSDVRFLFHVLAPIPEFNITNFPFAIFAEPIEGKQFTEEGECKEVKQVILWTTGFHENSINEIKTANDFHLYFLDVLKPLGFGTAEELYRIIDTKRGESYFLQCGQRNTTGKIIEIWIDNSYIYVFHFDKTDIETDDKKLFLSKWISVDQKVFLKEVSPKAIFHLPSGNFVLNIQEQQEFGELLNSLPVEMTPPMERIQSFATKGLETYEYDDCENCGS